MIILLRSIINHQKNITVGLKSSIIVDKKKQKKKTT